MQEEPVNFPVSGNWMIDVQLPFEALISFNRANKERIIHELDHTPFGIWRQGHRITDVMVEHTNKSVFVLYGKGFD